MQIKNLLFQDILLLLNSVTYYITFDLGVESVIITKHKFERSLTRSQKLKNFD